MAELWKTFGEGLFWQLKNELGYSFGITLECSPEAAPQALNKNAGCPQWQQKKGFLRL
jgi:hypothetical protein